MRFSQALIPTLRDDPADAEIISHRLMMRAGLIRKVAAGIYTYLPLAWRAIRKAEQIIREEMEKSGAQELRMPAVQPAELWKETGRWGVYGKELLRVKDRHNRDFCVGPTHEEIITDLIRGEVRSYKQLPLNLYQMQTKFRDEIRPRFGLMRGREFIMKDGYSFDADDAGAETTYHRMEQAYHRIFSRMGLDFRAVEADPGQIGGSFSHEFMVLADSGEDDVVFCDSCGYAANSEKAVSLVAAPEKRDTKKMETADTPGVHSVEEVAGFLKTTPERLIKTLIFDTYKEDETGSGGSTRGLSLTGYAPRVDVGLQNFCVVLIRGDREVNETKLANHLGVLEVKLASDDKTKHITGGAVGFSGPVDLKKNVCIVADRSVTDITDGVTGANAADKHLVHVLPERDFKWDSMSDFDTAQAGDSCTRCDGGTLNVRRGIEVGHIFKLGTKYSESMKATFLDDGGKKKPFVLGCYGIGVGRSVAAAVEQNHDDKGIVWPMALAPYQVHLIAMNMKSDVLKGAAEALYAQLSGVGIEVLYDDRKDRAGVKFNDADLLGLPIVVVLGDRGLTSGIAEVRTRATGENREVPLARLADEVANMIRQALQTDAG